MDADALLVGLDPNQRRAVTHPSNPLCIMAGAGSGKTRVLTRRIAWRAVTGDADPRHVLALTFTRKAAGELSGRLRRFGLRDVPAAGTFHATAWAQLRTWWEGGDRRPPTLLEHKARILRTIIDRNDRLSTAELAAEIEWAKARLVPPDGYAAAATAAARRVTAPPKVVAERYARYEEEKQRKGLVDFDDLLANCATALETDRSFGDAQRWRFRHLFVDEFQDVNPLQFRLLGGWLGDSDDLCVVGDANQAIYRWNGADASYLTRFTDHFPGAAVVEVHDNYRSSPQILAVASSVLPGSSGRPLRANRPDGPVPVVVAYDNDTDEANGVARALRDHHGPSGRWASQAVLVRTNAQTVPITQALRLARIPYRVRGGSGLLDDGWVRGLLRAACPDAATPFSTALADMEALLVDQIDPDAIEVEAAPGPTGDPSTERGRLPAPGVTGDRPSGRGRLPAAGPPSGRGRARRPSGPVELPRPMNDEQRAALEVLVALGREFLPLDPRGGASAFPSWLAASMRSEGSEAGGDAVDLATFHAAKGLEWEVVHLAGLEQGFVPISRSRNDPEAEAEERRLLYVAVTRAERELRVTWAAERAFGERVAERSPSPWLKLMVAATSTQRRESRAAPTPVGLAAARARLRPPDEAAVSQSTDRALLAVLQAWRARVARGADVPATVVLADRTLVAIAQRRPTERHHLVDVAGLGPLKLAEHGDTILGLVADHTDRLAADEGYEDECGSS